MWPINLDKSRLSGLLGAFRGLGGDREDGPKRGLASEFSKKPEVEAYCSDLGLSAGQKQPGQMVRALNCL